VSQLEVYLTTPHHVDGDFVVTQPAQLLARAWNFDNALITRPMGPVPAQLDISVDIYDKVHDDVKKTKADGITAYSTFFYVEWRGFPVFWGPIIEPEWGMKSARGTFRAYSNMKRLEFHQFHRGDDVIRKDNGFHGLVPIDYRGLRMMRDAGENLPGQDYPPLGLKDGTNTGSTHTQKLQFDVGAEVLSSMDSLTANTFGPEMLEIPYRWNQDPPYYAEIQTADQRELGTDRYNSVIFQGGFGLDNLDDIRYTPGGKIATHVHAASEDGKYIETRVDPASARENGVWVDWYVSPFNVKKAEADAILGDGEAQAIIDAYSTPPKFIELDLKKDNEIGAEVTQKYWMTDFFHGDFIRVAAKKGAIYVPDGSYRITEIGLKQEDQAAGVRQLLTVVPDVSTTTVAFRLMDTDADIIARLEARLKRMEQRLTRYVENVVADIVDTSLDVKFWVPGGELVIIYHRIDVGTCTVELETLAIDGSLKDTVATLSVTTTGVEFEPDQSFTLDAGDRVHLSISAASTDATGLHVGCEIR
jgi:hypothetical protein